MHISLTKEQILGALPLVERGCGKYLWLQGQVASGPARVAKRDFQRKFNGSYRIRRNAEWQESYYELLAGKLSTGIKFKGALNFMLYTTGRFEASFMSKLVATIHPMKPVIDSMVLENVGARPACSERAGPHRANLRNSRDARFSVAWFLGDRARPFPDSELCSALSSGQVTEMKMLDLVLWKIRSQ
jgi:hypothetical protein